MPARAKTVSRPRVPVAAARHPHRALWRGALTLLASLLFNAGWIVAFVGAVGLAFDLRIEHAGELPRMPWRATRI